MHQLSINRSQLISKLDKTLVVALVYIGVFFSSIIGMEVLSISLNTLCLIPLVIVALMEMLYNRNVLIPIRTPLFWFILVYGFSGLLAMMRSFYRFEGYLSSCVTSVVQSLFIFLPVYIYIYNQNDIYNDIYKAIITTCRIQVCWGLAQYFSWTLLNIDLNKIVLVDIFGGFGRDSWTSLINVNGNVTMRVTGLNHDGAYLGILLVIGLIIDNSFIMKALYLLCALVSMQRATIATIVIISIYYLFSYKGKIYSPLNLKVSTALIYVISICVLLVVFAKNSSIINRIDMLLQRFSFVQGDIDIGTNRHMLYIPEAIAQLLLNGPLIFMFGTGAKTSGLIFSSFDTAITGILDDNMMRSAWAIESDFACVFAGMGFVGGFIYLYMYWKLIKNGSRSMKFLSIALIVFGLMYNHSGRAFSMLLYMAMNAQFFKCRDFRQSYVSS